jgi:hypothetical protein
MPSTLQSRNGIVRTTGSSQVGSYTGSHSSGSKGPGFFSRLVSAIDDFLASPSGSPVPTSRPIVEQDFFPKEVRDQRAALRATDIKGLGDFYRAVDLALTDYLQIMKEFPDQFDQKDLDEFTVLRLEIIKMRSAESTMREVPLRTNSGGNWGGIRGGGAPPVNGAPDPLRRFPGGLPIPGLEALGSPDFWFRCLAAFIKVMLKWATEINNRLSSDGQPSSGYKQRAKEVTMSWKQFWADFPELVLKTIIEVIVGEIKRMGKANLEPAFPKTWHPSGGY